MVKDSVGYLGGTPDGNTFAYEVHCKKVVVSLVKFEGYATEEPIDIEIPIARNVLADAPYCMFAIPYDEGKRFTRINHTVYRSVNIDTTLDFVSQLSEALSGAQELIDIQLLPYFPLQNKINPDGSISIDDLTIGTDYSYWSIETDNVGRDYGIMMFWCERSTFSFDKQFSIYNPYNELGNPQAMKTWNETTKYRLCSPNFSSSFEFSPAKNNGIQWFNIDCSYKPYQPYIHVNPNFSGLYGKDFNDARGLICSGDFSLTQLNDAWQTYQWQNINFEKSFQRQIENMEVKNKYQKAQEITGAILGTAQAGISGGMTGALLGGPVGAGIGIGVGTAFSAAAGAVDVYINEKLRAEALDYTKDQFGYQLGNIQALPTTISKVSAFTANNKIFPVLEIYVATDEEIEAFLYKLGYNGMTVMRIGTLGEFLNYKRDMGKYAPKGKNYFKGKLINMEDVAEDFHIINALSAELDKGVFI